MKNTNLIGVSGKVSSGKDTIGNIIQIITTLPQLNDDGVKSFLGREIYSPYQIKKFADKLKDIVCILLGCTREQLEDREFKEKPLGEEWWIISKPEIGMFIPYSEDSWAAHGDFEHNLIRLTPRLLLQLLGTQCGREILHPNLWVNALMGEYKKEYLNTPTFSEFSNTRLYSVPKWIITDLRFENELEAIKQRNGITIRVERFCYDSPEDFLVCNPDPELRKIGIHDYNNNETLSLEEITDIAKVHGYIPLSEQHESETALDSYQDWDYVIENNGTLEDLIKKVREILNKENII